MVYERRLNGDAGRFLATLGVIASLATTVVTAGESGYPPPPGPYRVGPVEQAAGADTPVAPGQRADPGPASMGREGNLRSISPAETTLRRSIFEPSQGEPLRPPAFVDPAPVDAWYGHDPATSPERPAAPPARPPKPDLPETVFRPTATPP